MLIFQIKRIISSQKWFNYVVTFFLENAKNLGRLDYAKRRKKKEDGLSAHELQKNHKNVALERCMKTFKTKFDTLFWNRHLITLEAYQEKVVHLDIHRRRCFFLKFVNITQITWLVTGS